MFDGFEEFQEELREFQRDVREARVSIADAEDNAAREVAEKFKDDVKKVIKRKGLVEDGDLIESIRVEKVSDGIYRVFTNEDHAIYIEYGTSGPITANDSDYLKFTDETGEVIFRKSVSGIDADPFWRPTERKYIAEQILPESFDEEIEEAFQEAFD